MNFKEKTFIIIAFLLPFWLWLAAWGLGEIVQFLRH